MSELTIFGKTAEFIPHSGYARPQPIDLPSRNRVSHRPTMQIQELVAVSYGLHPRSMTSSNRESRITWPRQIAMYLTHELTKRSLSAIGEAFGGRHHTTVIHAIRAVEQRMKDDPIDRADVLALRKALGG